jgi:hypothetical protein
MASADAAASAIIVFFIIYLRVRLLLVRGANACGAA